MKITANPLAGVLLSMLLWPTVALSEYSMPREQPRLPEGMGETYISGFNFYNKKVVYEEVDGLAIFEGDIILGTVEEVEAWRLQHLESGQEIGPQSIIITGERFRWRNNIVPFQFEDSVSDAVVNTALDAIDHWEANTPIRFFERTPENQELHPDFVEIVEPENAVCFSNIGRVGGRQTVALHQSCPFGTAVHEFGHTLGLWHEHSREDRDQFVTIVWGNIRDRGVNDRNFNQRIQQGDDIGDYDYDSIMHYGPWAFAFEGTFGRADSRTIIPVTDGAEIGQRDGLSLGDIESITQHYPEFLPRARLTKREHSVFLGNTVFLDGRPSFSPTGGGLSFTWRLDDGSRISGRPGLNQTVTHTYRERGTYSPSLTVVDAGGNRDTDEATVHVYGAEVLVPIISSLL